MKDTYKDFKSLSAVEKEGKDFRIWSNNIKSRIAIVAPHGGGIEPGTSEIAKSIAGDDFACYSFEGIKSRENKKYLHLTSTNFDEPEGVKICNRSDIVLAVHGAEKNDDFVYVGGRNQGLKNRIIQKLKNDGFNATEDTTHHSGRNAENICNRCKSMGGLQLEISKGLRKKMLKELNRNDQKSTTQVFDKFVQSIRSVLCEDAVKRL
ncbi:MAG: poly-gamma-glutamate hydrolase family protein [Deltaproteobacteria bacterium]|nr:poly-gamma-glutamate hydrolase family protein [Deltaproteobacteria bacterium]MBW2014663.1 poly-gamma-glutamate hydrolase family protein [Deltaproteobacteria bacterium]MBW2088872.1 poly-gamma-glutamate hydrolase family protein [Deltaproteobacteria bacterium]